MLKCPVNVRANCGKHTSMWTISPHAKFDHLCNVEDHPLPTKSTKAIAEHLSSRIQHELHSLPSAPGLITLFKTDEGTHLSLKTVYRGIQLGKDSVFGTELESLCKLECYLERLVEGNPGSQMLFNLDAEGRFLRALYVALYAANFFRYTDMAHFRKTKYPGMTPTIVCNFRPPRSHIAIKLGSMPY